MIMATRQMVIRRGTRVSPPSGCKPVVCNEGSVLLNTLPLPNGTQEKSFVFGDHSPVYICTYSFSTSEDDLRREEANFYSMCSSTGVFEIMNVDDCAENNCGDQGDCKDLCNPFGNDSIHHCVCQCQSGYEELSTGTHKNCQNINDCPLSSPCNLVGACEDALQSYWCSCKAGVETAVLKNRPNNLTCTPQVGGEPPITGNSVCSHQFNSTMPSLAAVNASNASNTAVLFGETVTCTCDDGFHLESIEYVSEGF